MSETRVWELRLLLVGWIATVIALNNEWWLLAAVVGLPSMVLYVRSLRRV